MTIFRNIAKVSDKLLGPGKCSLFSKNCWNTELYFGSKIEIPSPPKKPLTAYMLFLKENRKSVLKENPSLRSPQEQIKLLAEKWNMLPGEMKKPYEISARESTLLYSEAHKNFYENLTEEQKEELVKMKADKKESRRLLRLKKALHESGLPKLPLASYAIFVQTESKNKHGIKDAPEFLKQAAETWKTLSEDSKKIYEDQAQMEKERYVKELSEWRQRMVAEGKEDLIKAFDSFKKKAKVTDAEDKPVSKKKTKVSKNIHIDQKEESSKN